MSKELEAAYSAWDKTINCKRDWGTGDFELDGYVLCKHTYPKAAFLAGALHERERILKAVMVEDKLVSDMRHSQSGLSYLTALLLRIESIVKGEG